MELIDTQLEGSSYTWFIDDDQEAASRIDRILFSFEWDECFRDTKQVPLQRLMSDHMLIGLQCGSWEIGKSYFKFQYWWLTSEGFVYKVREWWSSIEFTGGLISS